MTTKPESGDGDDEPVPLEEVGFLKKITLSKRQDEHEEIYPQLDEILQQVRSGAIPLAALPALLEELIPLVKRLLAPPAAGESLGDLLAAHGAEARAAEAAKLNGSHHPQEPGQ